MQRSFTGAHRAALLVGTFAALACVAAPNAAATAFTYRIHNAAGGTVLPGYDASPDASGTDDILAFRFDMPGAGMHPVDDRGDLVDPYGGEGFAFELNSADSHRSAGYVPNGPDTHVGWTTPGGASNVLASERLLGSAEGTEPVPEPTTMALLAMGLVGSGIAAQRRRKQQRAQD